jgi:hypothetical protein
MLEVIKEIYVSLDKTKEVYTEYSVNPFGGVHIYKAEWLKGGPEEKEDGKE